MLDISPYFGGDRIVDAAGRYCTAGFSAWDPILRTRGMLTAGHCGPPLTANTWNQGYSDMTGNHIAGPMGAIAQREWGNNVTDAEFLDTAGAGKSTGPTVYTTTGGDNLFAMLPTAAVSNSGIAFPGMQGVCFDGSVSGERCGGTVQAVDICQSTDNQAGGTYYVCDLTSVAPSLAQVGDSGGPVYTSSGGSVVAYGLVEARLLDGSLGYYSQITQALAELNVGLVTTSGNQPVPQDFGIYLWPNQSLSPNQYLLASNGAYELVMQGDGNLVLYSTTRATWNSGTSGHPDVLYTVMQGDGNLVIYKQGGIAIWNSGTQGNPGAFLAMQSDGNLVIYKPGFIPIWHRP
jgi:hypothetical protein